MTEDQRPGAVYWIDHYVVGTNDLARSEEFYGRVLGAEARRANGALLTDQERELPQRFLWTSGSFHFGSFVQPGPLPQSRGLGVELPRYGYFVRQSELDDHLRRLDQHHVNHSDPVRTSAEGQPGVAICWEDPDSNQLEFWAPDRLPDGAMDGEGPLHVGRGSGVTFGVRDLARSVDFFNMVCSVDPIYSADIPSDTASFGLPGGGRIVLKKVDDLPKRTVAHSPWRVMHTALAVPDEDFMSAYRRLWDKLPEWDFDVTVQTMPWEEAEALPARTGVHSDFDAPWKKVLGRGQTFYDWDTNACHFYPAQRINGSMATYVPGDIRAYYGSGRAA